VSRKVLIIGLGNIGFKYDMKKPGNIVHSHARAFSLVSEFELAGGVDPHRSNREAFQRAYSVPGFSTISEFCGDIQPEIVVIASTTEHHFDNIRETLACCKPSLILVEKPAAYTNHVAQQMIALSTEASVPVFVNLIRRTDPSTQVVKTMIESGEIETPCRGVVWYSKGLVHSACHFIDLLSWWLGDLSSVELVDSGRRINEWDITVDLRVCFGKSEIYFHCNNSDEFSYYSVELLARNGRLKIGQGSVRVGWQAKSEISNVIGSELYEIDNEFYQYQLNVVRDIARFLDGGDSNLPTLAQHVETLQPIYAVSDSWGQK